MRAFAPVNLRPLDEPLSSDLGNGFGLVFVALPVGIADPWERIAELRRRMAAVKDSPEGIVSAIGTTPTGVERLVVDAFCTKGSLVLTNVMGPGEPVSLAGTRLAGMLPWVPTSGGIALGVSLVSLVSYAGEVTVGVRADARLIPDPEVLVAAFDAEIAGLLRGATVAGGSSSAAT